MNQLLHAKIIGTGKPLLILHGFLGMGDNWKTLGNQYAESGYEVHLVDQRNHGRSFHSEDFSYEHLAKDLVNYLNHHQLSKVHLIGHSMGGKTAMQFACEYPAMVSSLIVADIAPKFYPPHHHEIIDGLKQLNLDTISSRGEAEKELANHISAFGVRQFLLKNLYRQSKEKLAFRFNLTVLANRMSEIGATINAHAKFGGPCLFLKGDKSPYISDEDIAQIRLHFPKANLETITNAGHWLHAENPKQFFENTLQFLNSN